jgi:hypothetical protein
MAQEPMGAQVTGDQSLIWRTRTRVVLRQWQSSAIFSLTKGGMAGDFSEIPADADCFLVVFGPSTERNVPLKAQNCSSV